MATKAAIALILELSCTKILSSQRPQSGFVSEFLSRSDRDRKAHVKNESSVDKLTNKQTH